MIKGSKAWHEVTAIVTKFFDNLNTSKYNYMGFLRSIDRLKYDSGVCISIFGKIVSRTSKESTINEKIKLEIIEYCNENIIFLKDSKIDDEGFRAMNDFSNFGKSYIEDLKYSMQQYGKDYTEIDFLNQQIHFANDVINNEELCEIEQGNKTRQEPYTKEEKELFRQRIFKFENRVTELKNRIDVDAFFSALNKNQKILSDSDVKDIIESISEFIKTKFEYFDINYKNNDFKDLLIDLFTHTTKAFQDFSDANTANIPAKKLAYINIVESKKLIKEKLLEFRNFYRFIQEKSTNDSNKLLLFFTTIIENYESICHLYGYDLKKSYCYDTINDFNLKLNIRESLTNNDNLMDNIQYDKIKEIHITDNGIEILKSYLKGKFNNDQQLQFINLLEGNKNPDKIYYQGSAIEFCRKINELVRTNDITTDVDTLIHWIISYFQFKYKETPTDFSISTVTRHLKSQLL
jgi:hypothetical protein